MNKRAWLLLLTGMMVAGVGYGQADAPDKSPAPQTEAVNPTAGNEGKQIADLIATSPMNMKPCPWPAEAREKGVHGAVAMDILVSEAGDVEKVDVVSGDPMLAPAAVDCVKEWKFSPSQKDGHPVKVMIRKRPIWLGPVTVRISPGVAVGLLIKKTDPIYPPIALAARIQGDVIFGIVIDESGKPTHVYVRSGHPMLIQAAMNAVQQWRFKPYLLNGAPAEVDTVVKASFKPQ